MQLTERREGPAGRPRLRAGLRRAATASAPSSSSCRTPSPRRSCAAATRPASVVQRRPERRRASCSARAERTPCACTSSASRAPAWGRSRRCFVEAGHEVSGSDVAFDPPIGPALRALGVTCLAGLRRRARQDRARPRRRGQRNPPHEPRGRGRRAPRPGRATSMSGALREHFLAAPPAARRRRHARQDDDERDVRVAPVSAPASSRGGSSGASPRGSARARRIGSTKVRPDRGRAPFVVEGDEYDAVYWHKQRQVPRLRRRRAGRRRHRDERRARPRRHLPGRRVVRGGVPRASSSAMPEGGLARVRRARPARPRRRAGEARARGSPGTRSSATTRATSTPTWLARPGGRDRPGRRAGASICSRAASSCGRFIAARARAAQRAQRPGGARRVRRGLRRRSASVARAHLAAFEGVRRRQDLLGEPRRRARLRRLRAPPDRRRRDAARAAGAPPGRRAVGGVRAAQRDRVPGAPPGGVRPRLRRGGPRAARAARSHQRARGRAARPRPARRGSSATRPGRCPMWTRLSRRWSRRHAPETRWRSSRTAPSAGSTRSCCASSLFEADLPRSDAGSTRSAFLFDEVGVLSVEETPWFDEVPSRGGGTGGESDRLPSRLAGTGSRVSNRLPSRLAGTGSRF